MIDVAILISVVFSRLKLSRVFLDFFLIFFNDVDKFEEEEKSGIFSFVVFLKSFT